MKLPIALSMIVLTFISQTVLAGGAARDRAPDVTKLEIAFLGVCQGSGNENFRFYSVSLETVDPLKKFDMFRVGIGSHCGFLGYTMTELLSVDPNTGVVSFKKLEEHDAYPIGKIDMTQAKCDGSAQRLPLVEDGSEYFVRPGRLGHRHCVPYLRTDEGLGVLPRGIAWKRIDRFGWTLFEKETGKRIGRWDVKTRARGRSHDVCSPAKFPAAETVIGCKVP